MDKIPVNVVKHIKQLIKLLILNNINIEKAFLFGSYAKGTYNQYSDVDLALVSDSFSGNRFLDKETIRKYVVSVDTDISPVPFRPEDFNEDNLFANEILKEGILIK